MSRPERLFSVVVGQRVAVYEIYGVRWPGSDVGVPVWGTVTRADDGLGFRFMPDLPDVTSNGHSNAHEHTGYRDQLGWQVNSSCRVTDMYVIEELCL